MGINALPNSTVRVLGACQVLNDPATVIKELVDNALDACATSIAIEIANNTVDSIQVRDNGRGIPPEDRPLVARPHCTSKIGGEDDLKSIGGSSLGFRGEALSSVAEMSGSLTISTRVEGEEVAIALKIDKQGEVVGRDRASLPVGTTVKITEFVKAYPVRNQNALKNSEKCLKKIKQVLQSYAFARPHVRFSLRVHKAKSDKSNWTYAPKVDGNVEDTALKIIGSACVSQCISAVAEEQGFNVQAFLPKVDAAVDKISSIGPFISVDGRPISANRGTCKQLVKIYREALKKANPSFEAVKEPFIYMDISCPEESYDANIEPAKDDVLFESPELVIAAVRRILDSAYPIHGPVQPLEPQEKLNATRPSRTSRDLEEDGFVTSLEHPRSENADPRSSFGVTSSLIPDEAVRMFIDAERGRQNGIEEPASGKVFRSNMYGCDEEDLDLLDERPPTGRTEAEIEEVRQAHKDVNISNPWVIAKTHAASRRPLAVQENGDDLSGNMLSDRSPCEPNIRSGLPPNPYGPLALPTPRPSSPLPSSQSIQLFESELDVSPRRDGRTIGARSLPRPQAGSTPPSTFPINTEILVAHDAPPAYDYTLSSQSTQPSTGTALATIPDASTRSRRGPRKQLQQTYINKPFVPPSKDRAPRENVWFDHLERNQSSQERPPKRPQYQERGSDGLVRQGELGDLIEDHHPLTPPRRNRDMRDFVSHIDLAANEAATYRQNHGNHATLMPHNHKTIADELLTNEDSENCAPRYIHNGPEFVPATELAAMDVQDASTENEAPRPTKRRKTGESRALRQLSVNSQLPYSDVEDLTSERNVPGRRRRTTDGTKSRRTKSSQLPLERVPEGQGTHHIIGGVAITTGQISHLAGMVDQDKSFLGWGGEVCKGYNACYSLRSLEEMWELTERLEIVLVNRFPDCEMVQDLRVVMQAAFTAHETKVTNGELV